jgi:hypothetical protein
MGSFIRQCVSCIFGRPGVHQELAKETLKAGCPRLGQHGKSLTSGHEITLVSHAGERKPARDAEGERLFELLCLEEELGVVNQVSK